MAENSKIEWCHHTMNFWTGCTKVSPACDNCYAESWAKRSGHVQWGHGMPRRRTTPGNWANPFKWDRAAREAGERHRVFCNSLSDFFDNEVSDLWRNDAHEVIEATPHLDWLILTKRPKVAANYYAKRPVPENVWLGVTCEDYAHYEARYKYLSAINVTTRFISYEPALGPLRLDWVPPPRVHKPDWVICGGESGSHARQMDPQWARMLRDNCKRDGIAFFMKQMTGKAPIPADLMVREFPGARLETRR